METTIVLNQKVMNPQEIIRSKFLFKKKKTKRSVGSNTMVILVICSGFYSGVMKETTFYLAGTTK